METMPVALFGECAKAEPVRQRLEQAGFIVTLVIRPALSALWFVSKKKALARLEVPADELERAEQFLLDWDAAQGALHEAIRCPECQSLRVHYPQYAEHSLLTNLGLGFLAQLHFIEKDFYCQDCHYTWPRQGIKAPRNRPHVAPFYFIEGVEQTRLGHQAQQPGTPHEQRRAA